MNNLTHAAGSAAELRLQEALGTSERAQRFYERQLLDHLNERMVAFVGRQPLMFVSTADSSGACDSSLRAGPPGFIQVLGPTVVAYPEYRGNGVLASLANITENPHVALLMIDFVDDLIGLHVNGAASICAEQDLRALHPAFTPDQRAEHWVVVDVEEAYIHCSKHIPRLSRPGFWARRRWPRRNGGDFFGVTACRTEQARSAAAQTVD